MQPHQWGQFVSDDANTHTRTCQVDGCGATDTQPHAFPDTWMYADSENHIHVCDDCGQTVSAPHSWSDWTDNQDGTHSRVCEDGCGAKETSVHTWGEWSNDQNGNHIRSCTEESCTATDTQAHQWGPWSPTEDGSQHTHSCQVDGCGATETQAHNYPADWSYQDETNHAHVCDDCGQLETKPHTWGTDWTNAGNGTHFRECEDGCGARETQTHNWTAWTSDENGHTHTCECGATETKQHDYGDWTYSDASEHAHACSVCGNVVTASHVWSDWTDDRDGTHTRTCTEGCGAKETSVHTWGEWSNGDGVHTRSCTANGCLATDTQEHQWSPWSADGDSNHSRTCTVEGCGATESHPHSYPETWTYRDENGHVRVCADCGETDTASHTWEDTWTDNQDGTHTRECADGCGAEETQAHVWGDWRDTEGETRTRDCTLCDASVVESTRSDVAAVLLREGTYVPYYDLQNAFDDAQSDETVYLVCREGGIALGKTLQVNRSVALANVTRTVGEDLRANYSPTEELVTLVRDNGFDGVMVRIQKDAKIAFERLTVEGADSVSPAVEVYGSLTVSGGTIRAKCAIRVCAPESSGIALMALGDNGTLSVTNSPELGAIRLDDPAAGVVPTVDFMGFTGAVSVEIAETRPYGAFAVNIGDGALLTVTGAKTVEEGLSARAARLQDGMYLCGGYDLELTQSALGEVVLSGECDEYLASLNLSVNGNPVVLNAQSGQFTASAVETGSAIRAELTIGGATASLGLVAFDETTGRLTAPDGATYTKDGNVLPLAAADPFDLTLVGDDGTVSVDGSARTLDFSRPVGTAFVYDYLTKDGAVFDKIDYTNYEAVQRAMEVYAGMTEKQCGAADARLAASSAFPSFGNIAEREKNAVEAYLSEKRESGRYSEEALERLEAIASDLETLFDSVDLEGENVGAQIEELFAAGISTLDGVRSHTVSTNDLDPSALPEYPAEETEELIGYLTREEGFRGDSELSIRLGEAEEARERDLVALFGVTVSLRGDALQGVMKVVLLLPEEARGYTGYRVRVMQNGTESSIAASLDGNVLSFTLGEAPASSANLADRLADTQTASLTFSVVANKVVNLRWLIILLASLCALEAAALVYVSAYLVRGRKTRLMAFSPALLAVVILPVSAAEICIALGAVCFAEALALVGLIAFIRRRERKAETANPQE